jgi:ferric-dicitrate binding protein FerR (iron transport regulator)
MNETQRWERLAKVLAGEATPEELAEHTRWLSESPQHAARWGQLQASWNQPSPPLPLDTPAALAKVQRRLDAASEVPEPRVRRLGWRAWVAAAVLALALGAGLWVGWQSRRTPDLIAEANPKGQRSELTLPDGSRVWLNADSRLEYPETFADSVRAVSLEGEAFFEVAHNPKQPFLVRLKTGTVRVLGTSFNVRAYPGDSTVETSVLTGRVAFIPKPKPAARPVLADTVFVLPDFKVTQSLRSARIERLPTVARRQAAWTENRLEFHDTPLTEIARTLERWYGTPVRLEGESQCRLTGSFPDPRSLREVMDALALTHLCEYELTRQELVIRGQCTTATLPTNP